MSGEGSYETQSTVDVVHLHVGRLEVDIARNCLRLNDAVYQLEPLVMDVLCYLAEHAGEVVARDAVIDHAWFFNPGADESLTRAVSQLRKVFGDDPAGRPYIHTIWKRGYVLVAEMPEESAPFRKRR